MTEELSVTEDLSPTQEVHSPFFNNTSNLDNDTRNSPVSTTEEFSPKYISFFRIIKCEIGHIIEKTMMNANYLKDNSLRINFKDDLKNHSIENLVCNKIIVYWRTKSLNRNYMNDSLFNYGSLNDCEYLINLLIKNYKVESPFYICVLDVLFYIKTIITAEEYNSPTYLK